MPRVARIVMPNCPHHITQRGNNGQDVFFVDDDRDTYLGLLLEEAQKHGLAVEDWKATLTEMLDERVLSGIRLNTHRGRPLGSDSFLSKIEALVGRRLRPLPVGRPRKGK